MGFFADNLLTVFLFPLIIGGISLFSYVFKYSFSNRTINILTFLSNLTGLIFSVCVFAYIIINNVQNVEFSINWLKIENFNFELGIYADKISLVFLFALMSSTLAIHYFSSKYLPNDKKYSLYSAFFNFINAGMAGLILSSNLLQTFIFGEIVTVLGYLLININFQNRKISNSARNFLILNKVGDVFMLVGIIMFIYFLITYPIYTGVSILTYADFTETVSDFYVYLSDTWFYIACLLLFCGIISKSAQFPLHVWVSDTAKAPLTITAMLSGVTAGAGIFTGIRLIPLFELSVPVMNTILYIGLITALICGFFAVAQSNIKKMLAYSSSSQLGLMVAAIGLNLPAASIICFLSHVFSKTVLFMISGSLYKISSRQNFNLTDFNISRSDYPILAYSYLIGIISISGLFFGGASANEEIIKACSVSMSTTALVIYLLICFITSYYLFRSYFVIFENNKNPDTKQYNSLINIPIIFLTLLVAAVSFLPSGIFEFFDKYQEVQQELLVGNLKYILTYTIIILGSVSGAYIGITKKKPLPKYIFDLSLHAFYIKKLYAVVNDTLFDIFRNFAKNFDKYVINWFLNIFTELTKWISWIISIFQNGNIQTYVTAAILVISLSVAGMGFILVILRGIIR